LAIPTYLSLLEKTTDQDSPERVDQLFKLLGETVIGSVWVYAARDPETIEASIDALPHILDTLGVCSIRFLKVRSLSTD
jgi:hypothetical protein